MNYDLLLHVDQDVPPVLNLAFNNAENYINALPGESFRMVMVVNGPGVKLLTSTVGAQGGLGARAEDMAARGLDIRVCANALKTFDIKEEDLWGVCKVIPAGVVEIVRLQREGFAYIKP